MMNSLQEQITELMVQIKLLQNSIWNTKISSMQISSFSSNKFDECELALVKCFDALSDIKRLEAVEQKQYWD